VVIKAKNCECRICVKHGSFLAQLECL
jgi:hypothetical protein